MTSIQDLEVNIKGNFYEAGGYAKVNRNLAIGLSSLGAKVTIESLGNQLNAASLRKEESKNLSKIKGQPSRNAIRIDSILPSLTHVSNGKYNILYTTIESYTVQEQFLSVAKQYNEIWVTSDFCKRILSQHIQNIPIFVMPCSIDTDFYSKKCEPHSFSPPLRDFVFISVFGWNYRKGPDVLLKTYLSEFTSDDDVSLLLVTRYQGKEDKSQIIKNSISESIKRYGGDKPPHIARYSKVTLEEDMPSIYRSGNAFILLTRGEGFGLPFAESSLCGLPVIGTNCSGQSMFLTNNNSTLIDIDALVPLQPGINNVDYWDNQKFPALTSPKVISDAKESMRNIYNDISKAKSKNKILQQKIAEEYSIPAVVNLVAKRLLEIKEKIQ